MIVIKRDGREKPFESGRIKEAIRSCFLFQKEIIQILNDNKEDESRHMNRNTERLTIDKKEIAANLYTVTCMKTMMLITVLVFVLNVLDIFIIEDYLIWITVGAAIFCWLSSYLVVKFFNYSPVTKYILFFLMIVFITTAGVMVTYHSILIAAMPGLCAVQYRNNKVLYYTYFL